jgi:hypothetical protein
MATKHEAEESNMAPSLQSVEISDLLKAILDELKSIRCELNRQDEQIRLVSQSVPISQGHMRKEREDPVSRLDRSCHIYTDDIRGLQGSSVLVPALTDHYLSLSIEMREGPVLKEAIHRYNNNCVPPYEHIGEPEKPLEAHENILFKGRWSSVLSNFPLIPNDNRLLFSFQDSELNLMSVADVDQLLAQLFMFRETSLSVSDHFDTGLCNMYQFMGETQGSEFRQKLPDTLSQSHTNWQMVPLPPVDVAPWRRVMYVMSLYY